MKQELVGKVKATEFRQVVMAARSSCFMVSCKITVPADRLQQSGGVGEPQRRERLHTLCADANGEEQHPVSPPRNRDASVCFNLGRRESLDSVGTCDRTINLSLQRCEEGDQASAPFPHFQPHQVPGPATISNYPILPYRSGRSRCRLFRCIPTER